MFALVAAAFVFSSCSDDDDKPAGSVSYDGENTKLNKAILVYSTEEETNSDGDTYYDQELFLFNSGFEYDAEETITGKGDLLYIDMESATEVLKEGTYTFGEPDEAYPGLLWEVRLFKDIDTDSENITSVADFAAGTVVVTKSGDKYTFVITGTTANAEPIVGSFTGKLETYGD